MIADRVFVPQMRGRSEVVGSFWLLSLESPYPISKYLPIDAIFDISSGFLTNQPNMSKNVIYVEGFTPAPNKLDKVT